MFNFFFQEPIQNTEYPSRKLIKKIGATWAIKKIVSDGVNAEMEEKEQMKKNEQTKGEVENRNGCARKREKKKVKLLY
ncbi:hypothetical protein VIGAN_UM181400 [Vigna angularis var. angularis]|uniref:Uncharacterized protein n=1 Tax=Vigna angularis var. angularis TaxID=157739 RepID=A0A0S3TFH8_PHAAN|nr:hypothetical protein VIGAN_UM181400 [Vigna angularis var. angularis]